MARAAAAPPRTATTQRRHPPYKEMILSAVGALKDRKGSSRTAIARFIESAYTDLPQTHEALLSTHIRRLREQGLLLMVKHSYKLAAAAAPDPAPGPSPARAPGWPPPPKTPLAALLPKRGRGRPPKIIAATALPKPGRGRPRKQPVPALDPKRRRGRPPKPPSPSPSRAFILPRAVKVSVALTERRKRGRPPKSAALPGAAAALLERKRGPGRPRKVLKAVPVAGRRRPGRPRKNSSGTLLEGKRKPGRPPKATTAAEGLIHLSRSKKPKLEPMTANAAAPTEKRKPGRPRKIMPLLVTQDAIPTTKRRGRPPKSGGPLSPAAAENATVSGVRVKRPVGRPRKVMAVVEDQSS